VACGGREMTRKSTSAMAHPPVRKGRSESTLLAGL
jgi:hypothetical protein